MATREVRRPCHQWKRTSGGNACRHPQRFPNRPEAMGERNMLIVAHIGDIINEYRLLCHRYFPVACPTCGGERFRRQGHYLHNVGDQDPVSIFRFRCNRQGCRQVFTVLPDLFIPQQSLPAEAQEQAVFQYAATVGTCSQVAQRASVCTSTIWRWVERAAGMTSQWVTQIQTWLRSVNPGVYVAADVDESLRPRWHTRRLRVAGKLTCLLLLDRLPTLVRECRQVVAALVQPRPDTWMAGLPTTTLGFCRQVLPSLSSSGA